MMSLQSQQQQQYPVVIVGMGLGGLSTAVALKKRGVTPLVVESSSDLRREGSAIGFWTQAWRAFDYLGIGEPLRSYAAANDVCLFDENGRLLKQFPLSACEGGPHEFRYVHRAAIAELLAAQLPVEALRLGATVVRVETDFDVPVVHLSTGERLEARVLVGADGIRSTVRRGLWPSESGASYSGYKAFRGICTASNVLDAVCSSDGKINQFWGRGVRMGTFKMTPTSVYWFITYNAPEGIPETMQDGHAKKAQAMQLVSSFGAGCSNLVSQTSEDSIVLSDIRDRLPSPVWGKGCVTLVGDAAHPMTPNIAQGGASAIEDGIELAAVVAPLLQSTNQPATSAMIASSLRRFERSRFPRILRLTAQAGVIGALLQLGFPPIVTVRNFIVSKAFRPDHFLAHTDWHAPVRATP